MSSPIIFKDRTEAGKKLANILQDFRGTHAIVLALPRGGIVVAKEVADALDLPLDIIVTRKIGAPMNPEYAIGAIDMNGNGVWNEGDRATVDHDWLKQEVEKETHEAERRWHTYRGTRGPLELTNKTVIIVDDGIATGMTMQAAVHYAKRLGAQKIVVAVPVASSSTLHEFEKDAEVRVLETPAFFMAVGQFYDIFPQVSDEGVIKTLAAKTH